MDHACKLLSSNEQTIAEIAYNCGFSALANFNRQFKKYKGMTPGEYRKKLDINPAINMHFSKREQDMKRKYIY